MQGKCACGRTIYPKRNSTILPKQCPSCMLKNLVSGGADAVKLGLKNKKVVKRKTKVKKSLKTSITHKQIDKKLDVAWSKLVKLEGGNECEYCGKTKPLNSHHIFSRIKHSVRWDTINGICLCVGHHIGSTFSAHKTGVEFTLWLIEKRGQDFVDKLRFKATGTSKLHIFEKQILLQELNDRIKTFE